jgi:hypothetical protein
MIAGSTPARRATSARVARRDIALARAVDPRSAACSADNDHVSGWVVRGSRATAGWKEPRQVVGAIDAERVPASGDIGAVGLVADEVPSRHELLTVHHNERFVSGHLPMWDLDEDTSQPSTEFDPLQVVGVGGRMVSGRDRLRSPGLRRSGCATSAGAVRDGGGSPGA